MNNIRRAKPARGESDNHKLNYNRRTCGVDNRQILKANSRIVCKATTLTLFDYIPEIQAAVTNQRQLQKRNIDNAKIEEKQKDVLIIKDILNKKYNSKYNSFLIYSFILNDFCLTTYVYRIVYLVLAFHSLEKKCG